MPGPRGFSEAQISEFMEDFVQEHLEDDFLRDYRAHISTLVSLPSGSDLSERLSNQDSSISCSADPVRDDLCTAVEYAMSTGIAGISGLGPIGSSTLPTSATLGSIVHSSNYFSRPYSGLSVTDSTLSNSSSNTLVDFSSHGESVLSFKFEDGLVNVTGKLGKGIPRLLKFLQPAYEKELRKAEKKAYEAAIRKVYEVMQDVTSSPGDIAREITKLIKE